MNDGETHYIDFDPEALWDRMHRAYIQAGGDILYPGDEKEILLRAVQAIAVALMADVDSALRMDTLTYAIGEYLKLYGEKRNCFYQEAVAATAPVKITFGATGYAQALEAGTLLTADGTLLWELTESIEITGTAQETDTTVRCATPGAVGNGLYTGVELQFIQPVDGLISAVVTADASGGVDAEDEEAYRERIRRNGLASVTTGPSMLYESQALAVSTQILDAKALNDGGGEVGIYLILESGADQQAIFAAVEQALSPTDKRPLSDHVTVYAATEAAYTLNVKAWYDSSLAIGSGITDAVNQYQAWQDNKIGRAFNPDRLLAMLYQLGCERVKFLDGSGMSGAEEPEYTEIAPRAHCKGTITITVVNT
jgi:phage-related baseplate assembly protein